MLTESLPWWPVDPSIASTPLFALQLDLVRALWVVLPAAILWGASFPLACAAVARTGEDAGRVTGGVYAANTLGGIVGALNHLDPSSDLIVVKEESGVVQRIHRPVPLEIREHEPRNDRFGQPLSTTQGGKFPRSTPIPLSM